MDDRIYMYEYRRPRLSNPTYLSQNVNNVMTSFVNPKQFLIEKGRFYQKKNINQAYNPSIRYSINKQQSIQNNYRQKSELRQQNTRSNSHLSNYGSNALRQNDLVSKVKQQNLNQYSQDKNVNSLIKNYNEQIEKYNKVGLEHKDVLYFKKLQTLSPNNKYTHDKRFVAGKPAYSLQTYAPIRESARTPVQIRKLKNVDQVYL